MPAGNCACHVTVCVTCDIQTLTRRESTDLTSLCRRIPASSTITTCSTGFRGRRSSFDSVTTSHLSYVSADLRSNDLEYCSSSRLFTVRLHVMHGIAWESYPSVCQTRELWQNDRNFRPHSYTKWQSIRPSFLEEERLVGKTPSTWDFWSNWRCWGKTPIFNRYLLIVPKP